jgi:hypothetical protein
MTSEEVSAWLEPLLAGAEHHPNIDLWGLMKQATHTPYARCPSRMWPTGWVGGRTRRTSPWSWTGSSSASCSASGWAGRPTPSGLASQPTTNPPNTRPGAHTPGAGQWPSGVDSSCLSSQRPAVRGRP